jgi:hypothetical protein
MTRSRIQGLPREVLEQIISTGASLDQITGPQGHPEALGSVVRPMQSKMAPPGSPVVPKMMIGIVACPPTGECASCESSGNGWFHPADRFIE